MFVGTFVISIAANVIMVDDVTITLSTRSGRLSTSSRAQMRVDSVGVHTPINNFTVILPLNHVGRFIGRFNLTHLIFLTSDKCIPSCIE